MPVKPQAARRFDGSSPVARYWLAQCEGFRVKGPLNGTVEQVVASANVHDAEALVVRCRGRRRNLPVEAVDTVVPAARLIVVDAAHTEATTSSAVAEAGSRAVTSTAAAVARVAPPARRSVVAAVRTFALLVAAGVVLLVRLVLSVALAAAGSREAGIGAREARRRRR